MVFRKLSFLFLMGLNLYTYSITPPPGAMGGFDPSMIEEQLLNQLMEEINAALPEDDREAFWEDVARETDRLEKETAHMNPEEKEKYLFGLMGGEVQATEPTIPEVQSRPLVKEEQKPILRQTVPVAKTEELMQIIAQIVKSIESFQSKAAAFPDFDGKALRWAQQGRITDWKAESWTSFQHDLSKLVNTLQRFKEKDPKIGFKHLETLATKEASIQNLKQLQKKLADYEPAIKMNSFEIASISEQTKTAAINTMNALTEALYRTSLPQELQKIIEEFDPIAKKIKEAEEKAYKTAFEESKKAPINVPVRSVGKSQRDAFNLPSLDDLGYTGRPSTRHGGQPGDRRGQTASDGKKSAPTGGKKGGGDAGKAGGAGKDDKKAAADKAKKEAEIKKKKAEEAKKGTPQIQHTDIKYNIEMGLRKDVEEVHTIIMETPEFQNIDKLKEYLQQPPAPVAR